jgi:putative tryptophan/tyrosine transport system substrate-binding protein
VLLAAIASACQLGRAQEPQEAEAAIAILRAVPSSTSDPALLETLRRAGYVPGRNLTVLPDDADEAYPDPSEAAQAVERWVADGADVIIAFSSVGAAVALETAPETPVLFLSFEPVAAGLVPDDGTPDRATGVTFRTPVDRTLDLTARAISGLETIGVLYAAEDPPAPVYAALVEEVAPRFGIEVVREGHRGEHDVEAAVDRLADAGVDAVLIATAPTGIQAAPLAVARATEHRLPVIANSNGVAGAMIFLYPDPTEVGRQLGQQAVRLLSGSTPSAVPVEDPRRFLITIDTVAAERIGIEVPRDVLREANEVVLP